MNDEQPSDKPTPEEDPFADLGIYQYGEPEPLPEPEPESKPIEAATAFEDAEKSRDESSDASVDVAPSQPKRKPRTLLYLLLGATAIFVAALGWLGWAYWVDREALADLERDLMAARDAAGVSSTKTEDAGEATSASAMKRRVQEITEAPEWDRVVVRIVDAERIDGAKIQADELALNASQRTANRGWWKSTSEAARAALAENDRTIPAVQAALDAFSDATEPHSGAGGFDPEARTALIAEFETNATGLLSQQDGAIKALQALSESVATAATIEDMDMRAQDLDAPLPIDRNPPELAVAHSALRQQATAMREFIASRDAIVQELTTTLTEIAAFSIEDGSLAAMVAMRDRLATLELPADGRFDAARNAAAEAAAAASLKADALSGRDDALSWIAARRDELDQIRSLEAMAAFAERLATDSPESDNPRIFAAAEDLVARLSTRQATLEEEKRLLDESIRRAALYDAAAAAVDSAFTARALAQAAQGIANAYPETPDQAARQEAMKAGFAAAALAVLQGMHDAGEWPALATALRDALNSPDVVALAPNFVDETAAMWIEASAEDDRLAYLDVCRLAHAPYADLAPAAARYLDSTRLRGASGPMHAQVNALLEAIETPGAALQIEGVEWASAVCELESPQTSFALTVDEEPLSFELGSVAAGEMSPVGHEVWVNKGREEAVQFGVSGFFNCLDDDGVFAGTGSLTMDDLRCGGRLALPFWNDGDQSQPAHMLLLVAIPDHEIAVASNLPNWVDPRPKPPPPPEPEPEPAPPVDPTDPSNPNAINE